MTGELVTFVSYCERPVLRGTLWLFLTKDGERVGTRNSWIASLCKVSIDQQRPIRAWSRSGWYQRELTHVAWPEEQVSA